METGQLPEEMPTDGIPDHIIPADHRFGINDNRHKRTRWLVHLESIFLICPEMFREDSMKKRGALRGLDEEALARWDEHIEGLSGKGRSLDATWDHFVEWTLSRLPISYEKFQFVIRLEIERTCMDHIHYDINESPLMLHYRLEEMERHVDWDPVKERAARFWSKMPDWILSDIWWKIDPLPKTREEWVAAAQVVWLRRKDELHIIRQQNTRSGGRKKNQRNRRRR